MAETTIERTAEKLQKDDIIEVGGQRCKVLALVPRFSQPGAVLIRFRLNSDLSRDFYSMWINSKFPFQVLVPTTPEESRVDKNNEGE